MDGNNNNSKTILVVEDQETISLLIGHLLRKAGYAYECAVNGQEALERLKEGFRPSLILLDVVMPVMDGYEFLDAMHEDAAISDIPVVMLTSLDHAQDVIRALKLGANDYCTKPIEPEDLLATVRRVVGDS